MTDLYRLLLGVFCVWRITHLFQAEDGPWNVIASLRRAAGDSFWGRLLDCFYCLSLWVSIPVAWVIGRTTEERILQWLAFSAGAILAERSAGMPAAAPLSAIQAEYEEDREEKENAMLRTNAGAGFVGREGG